MESDGDIETSNRKCKTVAQVIFLNPFTVCSSCKQKFVICPFIDEETNGSCPFLNRLNGLHPSMALTTIHFPKTVLIPWKMMRKQRNKKILHGRKIQTDYNNNALWTAGRTSCPHMARPNHLWCFSVSFKFYEDDMLPKMSHIPLLTSLSGTVVGPP
jgi:hypothetical protein